MSGSKSPDPESWESLKCELCDLWMTAFESSCTLAALVWSRETCLEAKEILLDLVLFTFLAVLKMQMFMVCPVVAAAAASKPPAPVSAIAVFYRCPWKYCRWLQKRLLLPSLSHFKTTEMIFQPWQSVPLVEHRCASSSTGSHGGSVLSDTKRSSRGQPKSLWPAWDSLLILGEIPSALVDVASPFPGLLPGLTMNPFLSTLEGQRSYRRCRCPRSDPGALQSSGKVVSQVVAAQKNLEEASLSPELQLAH